MANKIRRILRDAREVSIFLHRAQLDWLEILDNRLSHMPGKGGARWRRMGAEIKELQQELEECEYIITDAWNGLIAAEQDERQTPLLRPPAAPMRGCHCRSDDEYDSELDGVE